MDKETKKHPSYGNIGVSRISGRTHLFGTDVEHQHFIEVRISECEHMRSLSNDWYHPGREIISVWMTEMQWAEFVSSFNQGGGTPVTLRHVQGKTIEELPKPEPVTSTFQREVNRTANESLTSLKSAVEKLRAALVPKAKTPNKTELSAMLSDLEGSLLQFTNSLPFVEKQFTESMEHKMSEAKTAFDGYITHRLRELGLEAGALAAAKAEAPQLFLPEGTK